MSTRRMKGTGCSQPSGVRGHQQQQCWLDPCFFQDERSPGYWYLNFSKGHHVPALSYSGYSGHRGSSCPLSHIRMASLEDLKHRGAPGKLHPKLIPQNTGSTCWNIVSTSAAGHILQEWARHPCAQVFPTSVQAQAHQDVQSNPLPLCPAENSNPSTRDGSQARPLAEAAMLLGSIPALAFHSEPKAQLFQHW